MNNVYIDPELVLSANQAQAEETTDVIIRYSGDISFLNSVYDIFYVELLNQFAVARVKTAMIMEIAAYPQILYIEGTRQLFYEQTLNRQVTASACMSLEDERKGDGVCIAVIDSGVNLTLPIFQDENGESIFVAYWNQRGGFDGNVYGFGSIYEEEEVENRNLDGNGHGTGVASILATLCPESFYIGVSVLPNTVAFLCAIDFAARFAIQRNLPMVFNLSYGNNYGDHQGNTLVENYLDALSNSGRFCVVTGTGNDADTGRHKAFFVQGRESVSFYVSEYLRTFSLQLWSAAFPGYSFQIQSPTFHTTPSFSTQVFEQSARMMEASTTIAIQLAKPSPYRPLQEVYILFQNSEGFIPAGVWTIEFQTMFSQSIDIQAWLPVYASTSAEVFFLQPTIEATYTIPSTAKTVMSVGAYDQNLMAMTPFSGCGAKGNFRVPDVVAPGVDIPVLNSQGGITKVSGTSFATPFASVAAVKLMQWGIVEGHDPFLFGERLKTIIQAGAKPLPADKINPNPCSGYGSLCYEASLALLT